MQIEGSVRANMLAAIASARRLRGRPVHEDTIEHWQRLLDYAHKVSLQPQSEVLGELMADLEAELRLSKAA